MNQSETIARMQTVFDDVFLEPPKLTPALTATDVPEWDSLLHISILVAIEKTFAIRFRVGLTREDFAARYHVPTETLRAWERGEAKPDAAMLSYLILIDADPVGVAATLAQQHPPIAAE